MERCVIQIGAWCETKTMSPSSGEFVAACHRSSIASRIRATTATYGSPQLGSDGRRPFQRRAAQIGHRPAETDDVFGCGTRHPLPRLAEVVVGQASVEHSCGVVDLAMAHQVEEGCGHAASL